MPARLAPWPRANRTTLSRCLGLAALLHLWALLWLGSAPEGTAPPGQGVAGRLNVTLSGPADEGAPSAPPPQAGPVPADAQAAPRIGGLVRDARPDEPMPALAPGSARLGPLPPAVPPTAPMAAPMAAPVPAPAALAPPPLPQLAPLPPPPPAESRIDAGTLRTARPAPAAALAAPEAVEMPAPLPAALPATHQTLADTRLASPASPPASLPATPPGPPTGPAPVAAPPGPVPAAEAGPRIGSDVAVPAVAASAPPRLNLELGRLRGGELSRHGTAGVLPVLPRPPETDKLAGEIEKAARADCAKAYAGAGLLAVVPLAIDALRAKGCKW